MQICRITRGGVSLSDLEGMPIDKYMVLKKAAEIDELATRLQLISDINAAFSGNKKYTEKLFKDFDKIVGNDIVVKWEKDKDAKERLMRWKR